jgi:PAS domain S-box-containing protein
MAVLQARLDALDAGQPGLAAPAGGDALSHEERARAASDDQVRSILAELEVGVVSMSADGRRFVYANPAFERIVGVPAATFSAGPVSLLPWVHPDDQQIIRDARQARLQGAPGVVDCRVLRPDGETRWVRLVGHAVRDQRGTLERIDTLLVDRTEQRRAEDELQRSERRFRRMIERGWDMIALFEASGRMVYASGSLERILGYTVDEYQAPYLGAPRPAPPPSAEMVALWPGLVAEPGAVRFYEARVPTKGGGHVWLESVLVNLLDDPDVGAILANSRDVTARKEAEQALASVNADLSRRVGEATLELTVANEALAGAARAKDEFLANMSHELRTPLNGVLGLVEAIEEEVYGPVGERQRVALARIDQSGRHLLSLISDILDLAKIEAGKATLDLSTVRIGEACRASLALVEGTARQKQIRVFVQMADGFATLPADERKLKQILVNLLGNAVKFTPEGGEVGLEVAVDRAEGNARFTVWDRGIGIAPEALGRLFQPFVQVQSSLTRAHPGTGLGLALVRRLVDLHGGGVAVESEPGSGSRFTVRLPLHRHAEPTPPQGMPRVLVVEDNRSVAEQMDRYLAEIGVQALWHEDPATAVDRAATEHPSLVLLDILLPAAQGWKLLGDLRADPRTSHVPVIVASVLDRREQALALGAVEQVVKPVTREVLHALVRRFAPGAVASAAGPAGPALTAGTARRILLAEDDEVNVVTVLDFLRARGHETFVARDGREAIELAREIRPDAVLMDVQMPVLDGLSAIRALRADPRAEVRAVPIVALTALAMAGDRERCLEAGADAYLSKPVSLRGLAALLDELLSRSTPR